MCIRDRNSSDATLLSSNVASGTSTFTLHLEGTDLLGSAGPLFSFPHSVSVVVRDITSSDNAATRDPSGFTGVFGPEVTVNCTANPPRGLQCRMPSSDLYEPASEETLEASVHIRDLSGASTCLGENILRVVFVVQPDSASSSAMAAVAVDVVGAVATSSGTILGILGGASVLDIHTLVLLMDSPCASLLDHKRVNYMMYIVSPFFAIGYEAVVLGNMGIVGLVTVIQVGIASFFRNSRSIPWLSACAAVYFPSLALKVAELAYVGIVIASFSLLRAHEGALGVVVGVIGLAYVVGVPASVVATIHFKVNARMVQYTQFLSRPFLQRLMLPYGFWTPEAMERAYGRHIGSFLPGFRMYLSAYPMVVAGVVAIFTHLLPDTVSCFIRFVLTSAAFFAAALFLVVTRPHRIHLATAFAATLFVLLGIMAAVMAVAYRTPSATLEAAKLIICGILVFVIVLRVVFDGITTYLEWRTWRHFREQNRQAMSDEGVVGSANDRTAFEYDLDGLVDLASGSAAATAPKSKKRKAAPKLDTAVIPMQELMNSDEQLSTLSAPESSASSGTFSGASTTPNSSKASTSSASTSDVLKSSASSPSRNNNPSPPSSPTSSESSNFSDFSSDML
eukprot:TRINITY_DN9459_c0_g3_i4.p1 TRINITY_DN9459_c0_g3~~TRINITY_DN9459_c0_g3_i4.p1  ORF type:complete len:621 (+),score=155.58 TRINITY_DN9459_c0_g3_i4:134-1996(+)